MCFNIQLINGIAPDLARTKIIIDISFVERHLNWVQ